MTFPSILAKRASEAENPALIPHVLRTRKLVRDLASHPTQTHNIAAIAATLHDFGKLTTWFQSYIREYETFDEDNTRKKDHALIGAYAAIYVLQENDFTPEEQIIAFMSIAKHHGMIGDVKRNLESYHLIKDKQVRQRYNLAYKQAKNIERANSDAANKILGQASPDEDVDIDGFLEFLNECEPIDTLREFTPNQETYQQLTHVYGLLTCADKLASAEVSAPTHQDDVFTPDAIEEYVEDSGKAEGTKAELNTMREAARKESLNRVRQFASAETNTATLTLPTGFGKTLTGLSAATWLANKKQGGIIYALPFTSIIDQTNEEVQDVFGVSPTDPEYTIHHHLADTRTVTDSTTSDTDTQELLATTWQSKLTLTTFVQLFESLSGPTNRQSLKLPALENATIVVDEPQALNHDWWKLVSRLTRVLKEEYNADVILMTATQPKILEKLEAEDPFRLIQDYNQYAQFLEHNPRVKLSLDDSARAYIGSSDSDPISPATVANRITTSPAETVLTICNTVQSVTDVLRELKEQVGDEVFLNKELEEHYKKTGVKSEANVQPSLEQKDCTVTTLTEQVSEQDVVVATLTSRLRPLDRRAVIDAVSCLLEDKKDKKKEFNGKLYLVSTQVVEAGVDFSFDSVIRDFAPLSSLVQASGRCNRSFESTSTGTVRAIHMETSEPHGKTPTEAIYTNERDLLYPTTLTLKEQFGTPLSEHKMVTKLTESYYENLYTTTNVGDGDLVEALHNSNLKALRRASLIPDDYETVDVIVAGSKTEANLYEDLCTAISTRDFDRQQKLFNALKSCTISVPMRSDAVQQGNLASVQDTEGIYYLKAVKFQDYSPTNPSGLAVPTVDSQFVY